MHNTGYGIRGEASSSVEVFPFECLVEGVCSIAFAVTGVLHGHGVPPLVVFGCFGRVSLVLS